MILKKIELDLNGFTGEASRRVGINGERALLLLVRRHGCLERYHSSSPSREWDEGGYICK